MVNTTLIHSELCTLHFTIVFLFNLHRMVFPSSCIASFSTNGGSGSGGISASSSSFDTSRSAQQDDGLVRVCGSWRKFLALTDLLEYTLADVAEQLPRKKFAAFTGGEMNTLIKALFEDSPRRQTILTSILEMSK